MSDFHTRKAQRAEMYARRHGVKMVACMECSGTGYDADNGHSCYACKGTGKVIGPLNRLPSDPVPAVYDWRAKLKDRSRFTALKKQLRAAAA